MRQCVSLEIHGVAIMLMNLDNVSLAQTVQTVSLIIVR